MGLLGMDMAYWYLIISLICFAFLFLSVLLGDVMDMDMDADLGGPSPLSLPVILIFGSGFGAFGALFETTDMFGIYLRPFAAATMGLVMSGSIYFLLFRVFFFSQATTKVSQSDLIGEEAQVWVPINPGSRGQISVITEALGRTLMDAIAEEELSRDTPVRIVSFSGDAVRVEKVGE